MKVLVVGAGLAGMTAACELRRNHHEVTIVDTRDYIGGNCSDLEMLPSIYVHRQGPHIIHTDHQEVMDFLEKYTTLDKYNHRVVARTTKYEKILLPIPYNKKTERLIGYPLTDEQIVNTFFREYSVKMWGRPWEQLPDSVRNRVPQRREDDYCGYFTNKWQGLPVGGYTKMFHVMADGIKDIRLNVRPNHWRQIQDQYGLTVFTGSVDEYFDFVHDKLPYRSLRFVIERRPTQQEAPVINECNTRKSYTRSADYTWFGNSPVSVDFGAYPVSVEYPKAWEEGDVRTYPDPYTSASTEQVRLYKKLAEGEYRTLFCGRLGLYRYMDMDVTIKTTLEIIRAWAASAK